MEQLKIFVQSYMLLSYFFPIFLFFWAKNEFSTFFEKCKKNFELLGGLSLRCSRSRRTCEFISHSTHQTMLMSNCLIFGCFPVETKKNFRLRRPPNRLLLSLTSIILKFSSYRTICLCSALRHLIEQWAGKKTAGV